MKHLLRIAKGVIIGISTLVPGVSGGTMAIILGVYQDLIDGVSDLFKDFKKHFVILFEIALGGLAGMVLLSKGLSFLLENYEIQMQFLFIGIILGGLPLLFKQGFGKSAQKNKWLSSALFVAIGLGLVWLMEQTPSALFTIDPNAGLLPYLVLFLAGIIIAVALVLPGISASFMLLSLGIYPITLQAINTMNFAFLIPVGIGGIVGTFASAKLVKVCMSKFPSETYALIIGFVVGSIFLMIPPIVMNSTLILCLVLALAGFAFTFTLSKFDPE